MNSVIFYVKNFLILDNRRLVSFIMDLIKIQFFYFVYCTTQAKDITDFIVNETHFTAADTSNHAILLKRLSVIECRKRYNELSTLDYKPISLRLLVLTRQEYLSILRRYCTKNKIAWDRFAHIEQRLKSS